MSHTTERPHRIASAGFSLSELLVCLSVLGALATVALPTAWTYLPAAAASARRYFDGKEDEADAST